MFVVRMRALIKSPWVQVCVGLGMIVTALADIAEPLFGLEETGIGAEHGVFLFGLAQLAKGIVDGVEGAEKIEESVKAGWGGPQE